MLVIVKILFQKMEQSIKMIKFAAYKYFGIILLIFFKFLIERSNFESELAIKEEMKNPSWIRKNWLLVAGVTFVGVHLGTYFMQRAAKESVRSQSRDKQRNIEE